MITVNNSNYNYSLHATYSGPIINHLQH